MLIYQGFLFMPYGLPKNYLPSISLVQWGHLTASLSTSPLQKGHLRGAGLGASGFCTGLGAGFCTGFAPDLVFCCTGGGDFFGGAVTTVSAAAFLMRLLLLPFFFSGGRELKAVSDKVCDLGYFLCHVAVS